MTLKKYNIARAVIAALVAILVSQSIVLHNYFLPIMGIAFAMMILFYMRGKLKNEVLEDERDYEIGGNAARWAIQIFSFFAAFIMIFLYAKRDINPSYLPIASTLAYSTCFLMLLYSFIFRYFQKIKFMKDKVILIFLGILILAAAVVFGLRFFSGEDNWICQGGEWVQHGQPSFPAPTVPCK
jgi:uncharacterized membrane protein